MAEVPTDSVPDPTDKRPPELPLLRFSLRQLFWFVTVLGILLAGIVASSPGITPLVLLLAALVVALHVGGTALGSRLRAHADQQRAWQMAHERPLGAGPAAHLSSTELSTTLPLYSRRSSLRGLPWLVVAGALVGICGGAVLLSATIGHRTSGVGIAVGAISLGIVGAWFAFLGGSFWGIVHHGWREAVSEQKKDESRRNIGSTEQGAGSGE